MIFCLIATLLILAIAYFQSRQGLFSAMITAILTLLCAGIAVNWYQPLARAVLYESHQEYAEGLCLVLLFGLPLYGVRLLFDWLIGGNVVMNRLVDMIGGGLIGLLTGILHVGVLTIALQTLPLSPSFLGFQPFDENLDRRQGIWLFYPDEATLALAGWMSGGPLGAEVTFDEQNDDLLRDAFAATYRPEVSGQVKIGRNREEVKSRRGRIDGYEGDLTVAEVIECPESVVRTWQVGDLPEVLDDAIRERKRIVMVRVRVSPMAAETIPTKTPENWWLLPAGQFRLVTAANRSYYPVGYLTFLAPGSTAAASERDMKGWAESHPWQFIGPAKPNARSALKRLDVFVQRPVRDYPGDLTVDWVYVLPPRGDRSDPDSPALLIFRRGLTVELPKAVIEARKAALRFLTPSFFAECLKRGGR